MNAALLPPLAALTDADARAWMMSGVQAVSPVNKQIFWYLHGAWNYYGDMSVTFSNTAVTAAVGNDGKVSTSDPIVGQAINLLGSTASYTAESAVSDSVASAPAVICDLDPLGTALTQIFVGGLTLGDDRLGFRAAQDSRAFARWVLWRNASTSRRAKLHRCRRNLAVRDFPRCSGFQFALNFPGPRRATEPVGE